MLTTIKTEISQINAILSWYYQNDFIAKKITVALPKVNSEKYRQPNRLPTDKESLIMRQTLQRLCSTGDPERQKRWRLYQLWLEWLENTFTRPHECRLLRFTDVSETLIDGRMAVQFSTLPETKTGVRMVYATSNVKTKLVRLYQEWRLPITPASHLFLLPSGNPPSSSWFSDQWSKLIQECNFNVKPRELTQYSLRHQGINTLLVQGVPPTKVADLAGHSLSIQQRIYKKYSLENDHSVLRNSDSCHVRKGIPTMTDEDFAEPWEVNPVTGEWFPE
jgi:integrase